ncbi:MAG: PhnD/SsuA/transferrin family substrate-binding protein [Gammaproteobacteria bacterium]|jgi:phosphonate transport system substrate-binding protein
MVKSGLKSLFVAFISVLVISVGQSHADSADQVDELVFGVLPQGKNDYIQDYWQQLVDQISLNSGQRIRFESAADIEEFEQKLSRGAYDFVLLNANLYTQAHDSMGYEAFAKEADQKDKGVIVVRRSSGIKTLSDLKSQTLAMSDPRLFDSTVLTRAHLVQKGIPVNEEYLGTDSSVYRAVVHGDSVAGAGELSTLNGINPAAHSKLRVIWSSKEYSSNAFAAHPRVNAEQVARFREALLSLNRDIKGKRLLSSVKFKGVAAASDQEWNDIRTLKGYLSQ